ncbi:MAG: acetylornithine/succinylornithine family transaminase [Treponema sp.]|nr:acetylornithine/succinylornithine family transaminase [Treponema sp.]
MGSKTILNNYGSFDVTFVRGEGSTLYDSNSKKYIDFLSGIAVNCLGHGYKPLVDAVSAQAAKQIHICNYFTSDVGNAYAESLLAATGFSGVFFGNSGAEANEAAIKLARKYGYLHGGEKRRVIYTLESSFHGRTLATLTATGQEKFHPPMFAPYVADMKTIKAGDFDALKTAFDETTAALLIECVQGEGGVNVLDKAWVQAAAEAARKAGAIVMADEVQTGMGRTGTLLASEQLGFNPDVVTLAKGIAGGVPMGACLYRGKAADVYAAGDHQSTFGGNPLACAAAQVVLTTVNTPDFLLAVREKGEYIRRQIASWGASCVTEVRGLGLMIGVDIKEPVKAVEVETQLLAAGLTTSTAGKNTLRIVPPLNISQAEIDEGLAILHSVLSAF